MPRTRPCIVSIRRAACAPSAAVPKVRASIVSRVRRSRPRRPQGPARNALCSATPAATSGWAIWRRIARPQPRRIATSPLTFQTILPGAANPSQPAGHGGNRGGTRPGTSSGIPPRATGKWSSPRLITTKREQPAGSAAVSASVKEEGENKEDNEGPDGKHSNPLQVGQDITVIGDRDQRAGPERTC